MPEERPKGLLDAMDELEARRKQGKAKKPKDDDLDLDKVW